LTTFKGDGPAGCDKSQNIPFWAACVELTIVKGDEIARLVKGMRFCSQFYRVLASAFYQFIALIARQQNSSSLLVRM